MRTVWWLLLGACTGAGTADTSGDDTSETDVAEVGVTYHGDIRAIVDRSCLGCHAPGGIGPIDLSYSAEAWASGPPAWTRIAVDAMESGAMPPWMPDATCHPIAGSRELSAKELKKVSAWADAGFPEGDPALWTAQVSAPPAPELEAPDVRLPIPTPYTPDPSTPDDYRCFVLDAGVEKTTWLRAFAVEPDKVEVVHHALLYRLDAEWADEVAGWDAADEGPGYRCFGSPGTWEAETVSGWAPGQQPEVYGEGVARRIAKGSQLILQMHYNIANLGPGDPLPADQSAVALWTLPDGEQPLLELISLPFAKTDLDIPAGQGSVVQTEEVDLSDMLRRSVPIRGAFPHMHRLGTSLRVDVLREDGSEECVVHVPAWDFDWQQTYFFPPDDPIFVSRFDDVRITCNYDNSAANQSVVNGEAVEPRDVSWGEGTFDEMCLAYLYVTLPVAP